MGALSVTANAHYREPFEPLIPGVTFVAPDDIKGLEAAVTSNTAAVIAEPVISAGGVIVPPDGYFDALQAETHKRGMMLILCTGSAYLL